jgi:hypothetical protein
LIKKLAAVTDYFNLSNCYLSATIGAQKFNFEADGYQIVFGCIWQCSIFASIQSWKLAKGEEQYKIKEFRCIHLGNRYFSIDASFLNWLD